MYFGRNGDKMRKKGKRVKAMKRLCAFLLAAVLAGAVTFAGRAPLGVSFVAAAGSGLFGASALVGACFGSLTALDFSTALAASTLAALAGWLILAWLCGPLLRKSCGKSRRHGV